MIRTDVELTAEEYERLREIAAARQVSVEAQIKLVLSSFLGPTPHPRGKRVADIAGAFRPVVGTDVRPEEQRLVEAIVASKSLR